MEDVCTCQLAHLVALRPEGFPIDIDGAHAHGSVPGAKGLEANEELWKFICNSPYWRRPAFAVARTFDEPLLDTRSPTALSTPNPAARPRAGRPFRRDST
ncbi:hypothetical protein ACWCQQ_45825 [Streptomyces sp. NPDC002143]